MGPKKKSNKEKQGQAEKDSAPFTHSEYDAMDSAALREVIEMLQQKFDQAQMDRNYIQHERDTIETYYILTKQEAESTEQQLLQKDREMEMMENDHHIQIRVYAQKVKHLQYEHQNTIQKVQSNGTGFALEESDLHQHREKLYRAAKHTLKNDKTDLELANQDEMEQMKLLYEKNIAKLRQEFTDWNKKLDDRCANQLEALEKTLQLRCKVDVHEIEERKNMHINDLMKNHENAFYQIRTYYNDITKDNLLLIDSLKTEIERMKKKAITNAKLMHDVAVENRKLSEPLAVALKQVEHLRNELKGRKKDALSRDSAKARVRHLTNLIQKTISEQADRRKQYIRLTEDRNRLYDLFEQTVQNMYQRNECKNAVLLQQMEKINDLQENKDTQLVEILQMATMDPSELQHIKGDLESCLASKNGQILSLQKKVARTSKAYNDSVRACTQKLRQLGVSERDSKEMNIQLLHNPRSGF